MKTSFLLFFVAGVVFAGFSVSGGTEPCYAPSEIGDTFEALRENIRLCIEDIGVDGLVSLISEVTGEKKITQDDCHILMHLAGHEAYIYYDGDIEEILSASTGTECIGGYLHGVEADIVLNGPVLNGIEPKKELNALCTAAKKHNLVHGPCFHGVGHGMFELTRDIEQSLSFCNSLVGIAEDNPEGCWQGVFSELGNFVTGYDTNSGIAFKRRTYPGLSVDRPFHFCDSLNEKYRFACYTQLSKVFYAIDGDVNASLGRCRTPLHTEEQISICIRIVSGIATRYNFSFNDAILAPPVVHTMPVVLQRAAVDGFKEGFTNHAWSGHRKNWHSYCSSLLDAEIREYCRSLFEQ